jgi:hypothetical protein
LLLDLADDLLLAGPDPEIEAIYDRYAEVSHAAQRQEEVEMAEALVEELFGPDAVEGHEAQSVEELLRHAGDRFFEQEKRAREDSASHGDRRRRDAAARKAQAAREAATLSVREIYRKLVSALHPDRETDTAERERKTVLMQRANQAYERSDLLELLALQIEIEQIDAEALAAMPETRLAHYNQVLQEQIAALETQIEQRVAIFRVELDLPVHAVTRQLVEQALSARVAEARSTLARVERELARLIDPATRRAALNDLPEVDDEDDDLENLAALAAMFDSERKSARPRARKRKRRKR